MAATTDARRTLCRLSILLCVGVTLVGAAPPAEPPPDPLPLVWCLERASTGNPDLDVARSAAEAADAGIYPSGALPDPRIGYELSNLPIGDFDLNSTPMSGQQLGLRQKFPFPGTLRNNRNAARSAAGASHEDLTDRSHVVAAAVERAWVDLGFAQRALDVTLDNIGLLRQLTKIAEAKYRVGGGLQEDVIRAQVTLTELLDEQLQREAAIQAASARLAQLLDLSHAQFPRTEDMGDAAPLPDLELLLEQLETTSPRLAALRQRTEAADHRARAAKFEGYPDFDLGVGYRIRQDVPGDPVEGDDFLSFGVDVRLPVDRKRWRGVVAERNALTRQSEAEYRRVRAQLRDGLRTQYAHLERADREISLLENGLVPQARQSLDASLSGYEVDAVDFLSLIDSQVRLFNARLRLQRAIADRRAAYATVEAILGATLR